MKEFDWVNNLEEYDATPVGTWMKDPQGNIAKKQNGLTPNDPGIGTNPHSTHKGSGAKFKFRPDFGRRVTPFLLGHPSPRAELF